MLNLVIFILSSAGLTWIITRSKIFKPFRERISHKRNIFELSVKSTELKSFKNNIKYKLYWFIDEVISCYGCCGVWAGMIVYLLQKFNVEIVLHLFIASIVCSILVSFIAFLERK